MTRTKKLIILIVVLIVCIGGFFLVRHFLSEDSASDSAVKIASIDSDKVESIKWVYDGDTFEIKKTDGNKWYYVDNEDFPLDSEKAADMLSAVSTINAVKKISDDPTELSQYGIDQPAVKLYVTAEDKTTEYDIGDYNSASGYYYMMYTDDPALYYIDSNLHDCFAVKMIDTVAYEYLPEIETTAVESMNLESGGNTYEIKYYPDGVDGYSDDYTYFVKAADGKESPCDTELISSLITGFVNVQWASCEAYNVKDTELSKYGLDKPSACFSIEYTYTVESESESGNSASSNMVDGNDTLLIGSVCDSEKSTYYAMIKGGNCVYTLSKESADIYNVSAVEDLLSKTIFNVSETDIESMQISYKGNNYTVSVGEGKSTDENGTETKVNAYTINGKTIDLASFVTSVSSLSAETVQGSDISGAGDKLIGITVKLKDGTSTSADIYEYDEDLCAVSVNGSLRYFADESKCDDIYDAFRTSFAAMNEG